MYYQQSQARKSAVAYAAPGEQEMMNHCTHLRADVSSYSRSAVKDCNRSIIIKNKKAAFRKRASAAKSIIHSAEKGRRKNIFINGHHVGI